MPRPYGQRRFRWDSIGIHAIRPYGRKGQGMCKGRFETCPYYVVNRRQRLQARAHEG